MRTRALAIVLVSGLLLVGLTVPSCWRDVPVVHVEANESVLNEMRVRLTFVQRPFGPGEAERVVAVELMPIRVQFPFLEGTVLEEEIRKAGAPTTVSREPPRALVQTFDLRTVEKIEVLDQTSTPVYVLGTVGVLTATVAAAAVIAVAGGGCPYLHVDRGSGMRFAGVPYAGALFRSIQRDDLLPLAALPEGKVAMQVVNGGADEMDANDRLELVLVDHAPAVRAVATHDAKVVLLGEPVAPIEARDGRGRQTLAAVANRDGDVWETDMAEEVAAPEPRRRESLELTFARPNGAGQPTLELVAGNTSWIEVVLLNELALYGGALGRYVDHLNDPSTREEMLRCRDGDGVDMRVEIMDQDRWTRVAVIPSAGTMRAVAVPLPITSTSRAQEIRVRVSSGIGFWRIDQAALSNVVSVESDAKTYRPSVAIDGRGADVRSLIASTDGQYQRLTTRGARLDLTFDVPPSKPGMVRTAFFSSSGYYNIRSAPKGSSLSPLALLRLNLESESLPRLSLDLARDYGALAKNAGPFAPSAHPIAAQ